MSAPPSRSTPSSTCSWPISLSPAALACSASSSAFFAPAVNGRASPCPPPALQRARPEVSPPRGGGSRRGRCRSRLRLRRARPRLRASAASGGRAMIGQHLRGPASPPATPSTSTSASIRSRRACARLRADDHLARALEPLEHHRSPPRAACARRRALVDRLLAHAERLGDLLARTTLGPGVVDLQRLERLEQRPQGGDRGEPDRRVPLAVASASSVACVMLGQLH